MKTVLVFEGEEYEMKTPQQEADGPDVSDGHDCEGFPGGCERMGCPGGDECTHKEGG